MMLIKKPTNHFEWHRTFIDLSTVDVSHSEESEILAVVMGYGRDLDEESPEGGGGWTKYCIVERGLLVQGATITVS
jgi:hypothetical protein